MNMFNIIRLIISLASKIKKVNIVIYFFKVDKKIFNLIIV